MTAKEMFEELGYSFTEFNSKVFHRYEYVKNTQLTNGIRHQCIWFDLITKELYIHNSIVLQELKAINKQVEELGWLNENEDL